MNAFANMVLAAAVLAAAGCASTRIERLRPEPVKAVVEVDMKPVVEALLEWRGVEIGALSGEWKGRAFLAESVVKGEAGKFVAVLMGPAMRLFTVTLTPPHKIVCERHQRLPGAFGPERAAFDLAIIYLDGKRLEKALGRGFSVEERSGVRRVSANGRPVAEVVRAGGKVEMRNFIYGYAYEISSHEMR